MDYNWILLKGMRYYMETIKIQHLFGRFSIFFLVLIVAVFAEEYSIHARQSVQCAGHQLHGSRKQAGPDEVPRGGYL